jgi:hypothetical protein
MGCGKKWYMFPWIWIKTHKNAKVNKLEYYREKRAT